jgi:outer membrane protein OmpA-like peptidoglycan-associated protein
MTSPFIRSRSLALLLLGSACALGCASAMPKELNDARAAYRGAADGPAARYSPAQLHTAQQSLKLAEKTFEEEGDSAETRDRSYVAMRKAQLADTQARIDQTRAELEAQQRKSGQMQAQKLETAESQLAQEAERRKAAEEAARKASDELARLASVKQEERGLVITLSGSVLFASDKSELLPAAQQRLSDVAKALNEGKPDAQIVVEGHTDAKGSPTNNLDLSARRAEAVRSYLVSQGVDQKRIRSQGLGLSRPIADNKSAEGRANNRRVEIVVQPSQGQSVSGAQAVGT